MFRLAVIALFIWSVHQETQPEAYIPVESKWNGSSSLYCEFSEIWNCRSYIGREVGCVIMSEVSSWTLDQFASWIFQQGEEGFEKLEKESRSRRV